MADFEIERVDFFQSISLTEITHFVLQQWGSYVAYIHVYPSIRDVCVQYEINPPMHFRDFLRKTRCGQKSGLLKLIMSN